MNPNISRLFDLHVYARAHGARPQQNRIFAILLGLAIQGRDKLELEIHTKDEDGFDLGKTKDDLVAVINPENGKSVRAPLCKPLEIGGGTTRYFLPAVIAAIGKAANVRPLKTGGNGAVFTKTLSVADLRTLEANIAKAAGNVVPDKFFVLESDAALSCVA